MRGAGVRIAVGALALISACVRETEPAPRLGPRAPPESPCERASPAAMPLQYLLGDPVQASARTMLPAEDGDSHDGAVGVVLDGLRYALHGSQVRTSTDVANPPIQSAWRVPARLGGGFLFGGRATLYASQSFEGPLRPVVALPSELAELSFAPNAVLVRAESGERWMIDPVSARRLPMTPPGLLQIAALDDGRAAALVEGGVLLVSTDAGQHWTDATARLRAPPKRVFVTRAPTTHEESLWVEMPGGGGLTLVADGGLATYDALPTPPLPALRPDSLAWREKEAPLRRAMRMGAPSRDGSALVVASGDLVQVDLLSGAAEVVAAGKLPPDATCDATRTPDDVVFTCGRARGASFVVAHALDRRPIVEQTFADGDGRFVVSDDGGILWIGPCGKPLADPRPVACVRVPDGSGWQQVELDGAADAGGTSTFRVVRWIPRVDGGVVVVVSDIGGVANAWGLVDGRTGEVHAWPVDTPPPTVRSALQAGEASSASSIDPARLADRGWTVSPQGTLRGWAAQGSATGAVEIGVDGSLQTSPFTFERIASAGPIALARTGEGRIWQTLDRGATWSEVAAPPVAKPGGWIDPHACSLVGCDLGPWYRVGWDPTPPVAQRPPATAPGAPRIEPTAAPTLICSVAGEARRAAASRDDRSPDDLGLGASRVAVADEKEGTDFVRLVFSRRILGAVRDTDAVDETDARALVHGPATQAEDDRIVVSGSNKDAMALVRRVSFVPAFDPLATLHRGSISMRGLVGAARAAGVAQAEVLRDDPIPGGVVPVTSSDASSPDDLLVQLAGGAVSLQRATPAGAPPSRCAYEAGRSDEWRIVSAASLDDDGVAWLEEDASGEGRVLRLGRSAAPTVAFVLDAPPSADLYPANIDALAVGPRGELAVLRTPSGREPPSAVDPAVLLVPGAPAVRLAPWSTLTPADDAACKADAGGWRVTVQTLAPWLHLTSPAMDLRGMGDAFMLARIHWSSTRACIEGVELRTEDMAQSTSGPSSPWGTAWDAPLETWVVARFAGGALAGRVAVFAGGELRQPLECKLAPH